MDSEFGFFAKRYSLRKECCIFDISDEAKWVFEPLWDCWTHDRQLKDTHLSNRGWGSQEQAMAPRTLHFTDAELMWGCREEMLIVRGTWRIRRQEKDCYQS